MIAQFETAGLKTIFDTPADKPESGPMIEAGRILRRKVDRRRFVTLRNCRDAAAQIKRLPKRGETLHMLLRANSFSCFDVLPALIELAGRPADAVVLATLGINERHALAIDELATTKQIRNVRMILSHYFRSVDPTPFEATAAVFKKHGFRLGVVRSHVKLICAKFGKDHYVAAGSGNLRSCRSCENMDVSNDGRLFRWYAKFVDDMLGGET